MEEGRYDGGEGCLVEDMWLFGALEGRNAVQTVFVCIRVIFLPEGPTGNLSLTLTLGTACILTADGYVNGKQPREE